VTAFRLERLDHVSLNVLGVEFRFEDHGNAHSVYVRDPDENVIELTTYEV
jgi:hypothetical protein